MCRLDRSKKACDMVPHSLIMQFIAFFKIAYNVKAFLGKKMTNWKVELSSDGKKLAEVNVIRGIVEGESPLSILFVVAPIPLSIVLNKSMEGCLLGAQRGQLNNLIFMDD